MTRITGRRLYWWENDIVASSYRIRVCTRPIMSDASDGITRLRAQLREAEDQLDRIKRELNVRNQWMHTAFEFIRREYGFISFLLLGAASIYYTVRYHVSPFQDFAGAARSGVLARSYTAIGDRMMSLGQWEPAQAAFHKALELDPRSERASYYSHIARLMTISGPVAIDQALAQLVSETDSDAVVLFAQGIMYERRYQYHQAAESFRRSISKDASFIGSRINLGVVSLRLGDRVTYYEQTSAVYRLDSSFDVGINNMAYACELRHNHGEATRLYLRMNTIASTARTLWLVGTSMLYHNPADAERFLADCVDMLQRDLPDTASELGGEWSVGYVPVDTMASINKSDFAAAILRSEKLACALVSYGICDALAGNNEGARAKLDRAFLLTGRNTTLRRIIALQLKSTAELIHPDSIIGAWLRKIGQEWEETL